MRPLGFDLDRTSQKYPPGGSLLSPKLWCPSIPLEVSWGWAGLGGGDDETLTPNHPAHLTPQPPWLDSEFGEAP